MSGKGKGRMMRLGAHYHPTGHHVASWLHPKAQIDAGANAAHYLEMARTAERGRFDLVFLADSSATRGGDLEALSRWPQYMAYFEPLTLLSAMSAVTEHVGLVATASTSFNEPYNIARLFGSLDHLSHGRAGWNVVTSSNQTASLNFSREQHYSHAERYERAREFVQVVRGLWDSWDDDAFVRDRASQRYFLPQKLHRLDHRGKYYAVRGPLNMGRPPQGHPVIFQAGSSETGRDLAAETAEVVFIQEQSIAKAAAFYADVKGRLAKFGRAPDELRLMPGIATFVGRTEAEAREQHEFLQSLIHPDVGRALLSAELGGADLSDLPIDEPLPVERIPVNTNASQTTVRNVLDVVRNENPTIRQLYERFSGARGSAFVVGTAQQVADVMEEWFRKEAADGFIVQPSYLPGGLDDFVELVIPELQRRGLFRREYEGRTLRDNLGLRRPASRYRSAG